MTWTTVLFIVVAWCLVSVVAGFAFAYLFWGMTRIHPDEVDEERRRRFSSDQEEEKVSKRYAKTA